MEQEDKTKKRVRFSTEEINELAKRRRLEEEEEEQRIDNKKHTLDSDEEDNDTEVKKLDMRKFEGQEDATVEYDGEIKIMPFNMKDDLEEGYIDEEGAFVYKKDKEEIHDEWLDSVDWDGVKQKAGKQWQQMDDDEDGEAPNIDGIAACEKILEYLEQEESTVDQVLKKINSEKNLTAAEERKLRWAAKKAGKEFKNEKSEEANVLTGAVDGLISMGHMDAYSFDKTKIINILEDLERKVRLERRKRQAEEEDKQKKEEEKKLKVSSDLVAELGAAFDDDQEEEEMEQEPSGENSVPIPNMIDGIISEVVPNT
ncbi:unnamed protein product [Bursaphelenchus xylophilus]|uniref:(pine wood nematode) hypothetical protein n=1 Tax=Bursaphelenchus xylophilus TaxID=6326 RepID=A0A1I7S053_BURXY|nr:unnamed protein product [Bursaphelenchus xylophilus]CAG9109010.1 unnamed protein product [Bursaphelenchus xylophilus]